MEHGSEITGQKFNSDHLLNLQNKNSPVIEILFSLYVQIFVLFHRFIICFLVLQENQSRQTYFLNNKLPYKYIS